MTGTWLHPISLYSYFQPSLLTFLADKYTCIILGIADVQPEKMNNLGSWSKNHPDLYVIIACLVQSDDETLSIVVQTF